TVVGSGNTTTTAGLIATSGSTTWAFGNGTDVFKNRGNITTTVSGNVTTTTVGTLASSSRLLVGDNGSSPLTITGLETFTNTGLIDMANGGTTDHILAAGTAFNGTNLSQMNVNAFLGAGMDAQSHAGTGCSANAAFADCMVVGAVTGSTAIV